MACRYTYQGKTYEAHEFDDVLRAMPLDVAAKFMPGIKAVSSGPFVDDTKSYVALGLKRAIMIAVEAGQDRVAVVSGQQAADMFDLRKSVSEIRYEKATDQDLWEIEVDDKDGETIMQEDDIPASRVEELLGKEMAQKIVSGEGERFTPDSPRDWRRLTGLDLQVGGEGMRAFYDEIVPQVMRDVAKKLGGRVVESSIEVSGSGPGDTDHSTGAVLGPKATRSPAELSRQVAIEITPAMRSKVLSDGVPLFSNTAGRLDDIEAYHFSKAQRATLTGSAYGTGLQGSGRDEYLRATDKRRSQRVYFYVDKGTGIKPEAGVGAYAHRARLDNVYDINSDPQGLRKGTQAATETAVLDAGFDGYLDRLEGSQSGQVIMLGDKPIKVSPLPAGERPTAGRRVPPATAKAVTAKREGNELVKKPAPGEEIPLTRAGRAVAAAAPSYRMQYGSARVLASEAAAADRALAEAGATFRFLDTGTNGPQFSNAKFAGQDLPDETRAQKTRRVAQDYFLRTKIVQDVLIGRGANVGEAQDVYRAEERMYGRVQAQLEDFANGWIKPMLKRAADADIDLDELALYAYAHHAPERNAYIDTINPGMQGAGSGMSDADSATIIAQVKAGPKAALFESLRQDLLAITDTSRQVLLQDGLITQDEFDAWTNAYQDYVPLRGLENVDDEGRAKPGVGRGVNIRGKESIRALGRKSRAGDIIENIVRDYERAVIRGERNNIAKTLLDLVTTNPDPDLWEVNARKSNRTFSKTLGLVQTSTAIDSGEETIGVKVAGQQVYIKIKDKLLLRAMKQAAKDETGEFQSMLAQSLGTYNNWLRNTLTRFNPVFGAVNAVRDFQSGAASSLDKIGARGAALYAKHYRAALAASVRNERQALGKTGALFGDPVMDRYFQEFRAAGGTTGGWFLRDVEDIHTDIRQMMVAGGAAPKNVGERITGSAGWQGAKALLHYVEMFGSASENASRVAAYRAARELGKSPAEAASIAKNLTTNFNRKGEWGTALNSAYLFFNAAVQGSARVLEALKSRKVQALMAGVTGLAAVLALIGAEAGGDDDDGEAYWDKIPAHEKERNLIIMLPPGIQHDGISEVGTMGRYMKIPMPYGFNVFGVTGYVMSDLARHQHDPRRGLSPAKGAIRMVSAVAGSFNPMGGAFDVQDPTAWGMAVAPTIVDAGIQLGTGVNSFGTPVGPKASPFDDRPDSERFTVSQGGGAAQRLARWANEATGGNRARSGAIDVMPGTLDNVVNMAGGGAGRFAWDVFVNMPTKLASDDAVHRWRDVPFLRNFAGQVDENVDRGLFYTRMDEALKEAKTAKNEMKLGITVKYDPRSRAMQSIGSAADKYQGMMSDLRKEDLAIVNDGSLTAAEKKVQRKDVELRRNELVREFNKIWYENEGDLARGAYNEE